MFTQAFSIICFRQGARALRGRRAPPGRRLGLGELATLSRRSPPRIPTNSEFKKKLGAVSPDLEYGFYLNSE
jgi:hypothetical protein